MPFWGWDVMATWSNGKYVTKLTDYETNPDADLHQEILLSLIQWLGTDRLTREEKVDLMHTIRAKLKLPDIRNRKLTRLPYVGPEE